MNVDNLNQLVGSGINIYGSRERIRSQLIEFAKGYLELETVDFYKTSVISYLIDIMSILTANHLFYDSMIYREFFMVEAQLKESVYNLARWIGYEVPKAIPSQMDVLFTIPLTFNSPDVTFTIPNNFTISANGIIFTINSSNLNVASARFEYDKVKFSKSNAGTGLVINNSALSLKDSNSFYRPIYLNSDDNGKLFASFTLPFTQHKRIIQQFSVPDTLQPYQFYSKKFDFNGMVSGIRVWIVEPKYGEKILVDSTEIESFNPETQVQSYATGRDGNWYNWSEWEETDQGIYTLGSDTKQYVFVGGTNQCELFFGNGIVGKQPARNSIITVELYVTEGESGHIIPHSITKSDKLYYSIATRLSEDGTISASESNTSRLHTIDYEITNPVRSTGALDVPTLPEIKRNAITNLRTKGRFVSESDYDDINIITSPDFPTVEAYPILKRSDIKVNEIMVFILLKYHDEEMADQIVPTRNAKLYIDNPDFKNNQYTIMRTTPVIIDGEEYQTLFNITIDASTRVGYYDYVLQNVNGSPTILYNELTPSFYQQYSYIPVSGSDFNVDMTDGEDGIYPLRIKVYVNNVPQDVDSDFYISDYRCKLITKWGNFSEYSQIAAYPSNPDFENGEGYEWFEFEIPNYLDVPVETQRFEFHIEAYSLRRNEYGQYVDEDDNVITPTDEEISDDPDQFTAWLPLTKYYTDVIVRKDLRDVMMSSITFSRNWDGINHDYFRYYVHNVPVILSSYLDDGNGGGVLNRADNSTYANFETVVMQAAISNLELDDKKMLTDFINIKFPDTYGRLNNLKYNPVDHIVRSRFRTPFNWESPNNIIWNINIHETSSSSGQPSDLYKFIVNGIVDNYELNGYQLSQYVNYIAEHFDDGWHLIKPQRGMYVRVEDELDSHGDQKVIVYTGDNWIDVQSYRIPLLLDLKIEMDPNYTMSGDGLKTTIKQEIMEHFSPFMGVQKNLDRSEIVTVVRKIPGVQYCEVRKPEIDIKFDYQLSDLTQLQLIDYTPQYIGMVSNDNNYSSRVQTDGIQIEIVR